LQERPIIGPLRKDFIDGRVVDGRLALGVCRHGQTLPHSSWVATRRGLHKPVSSSPPFKTGLAPLRASGLTPLVDLHGNTMKRLFPFLQLHGSPPVDSLRVRWVPLFPSSQRLGAFAFSPHPGVHGFPVLRLLCPIRLL